MLAGISSAKEKDEVVILEKMNSLRKKAQDNWKG